MFTVLLERILSYSSLVRKSDSKSFDHFFDLTPSFVATLACQLWDFRFFIPASPLPVGGFLPPRKPHPPPSEVGNRSERSFQVGN